MRPRDLLVGALLIAGAAAAWSAGDAAGESGPETVTDEELSIYEGSVFEIPSPEPVRENTSYPGEGLLSERTLPGFPPVVPHGVTDFLPITSSDNYCVDCHGVAEKEEGEPTPIPASHYAEPPEKSPETERELAGARHLCLACHVPQTDAPPLVPNTLARSASAPEDPE